MTCTSMECFVTLLQHKHDVLFHGKQEVVDPSIQALVDTTACQ